MPMMVAVHNHGAYRLGDIVTDKDDLARITRLYPGTLIEISEAETKQLTEAEATADAAASAEGRLPTPQARERARIKAAMAIRAKHPSPQSKALAKDVKQRQDARVKRAAEKERIWGKLQEKRGKKAAASPPDPLSLPTAARSEAGEGETAAGDGAEAGEGKGKGGPG